MKPQIDDFVYIADALKGLRVKYQIDIASVRGFEYYTGVIFQVFVNDEKVGAGGRYDALIPAMGGKNTPASGVALYLDRLMQFVNPDQIERPAQKIWLKMTPDALQIGLGVADFLRESGYIVKNDLGGKGPGDVQWKLEVGKQKPLFKLTETATGKSWQFDGAEEVMAQIERI